MFDLTALLLFATANFLVLITPGPAVMYTITRSLDQGKRAGLLSVYGLALGTFPHALAVAFGVASLLASSVSAFNIMRYIGAGYLIYLGICRLREGKMTWKVDVKKSRTGMAAFLESFVVGVLNPKSVLFFLAFLPQFIDPSRGNPMIQTLVLWVISQIMAVAVGSAYALLAARFRQWLSRRKTFSTAGNYISGSIYIGLGLAAALTGSKNK
ncbi:MAG: LysE family translocator [candidate division Zixibacteria bacterium]